MLKLVDKTLDQMTFPIQPPIVGTLGFVAFGVFLIFFLNTVLKQVIGIDGASPHAAVTTMGACKLAIVQQRTSSYRSETAASTASAV